MQTIKLDCGKWYYVYISTGDKLDAEVSISEPYGFNRRDYPFKKEIRIVGK